MFEITKDSQTQTETSWSTFMGLAVGMLASVAIRTPDRETGHGHRLASTGTAAVSVGTGLGRFDMDTPDGRKFRRKHAN